MATETENKHLQEPMTDEEAKEKAQLTAEPEETKGKEEKEETKEPESAQTQDSQEAEPPAPVKKQEKDRRRPWEDEEEEEWPDEEEEQEKKDEKDEEEEEVPRRVEPGSNERARKRIRKKRQAQKTRLWLIGALLCLILLVAYLGPALILRNHFLPGTVINGVDCSWLTEPQAKEQFAHLGEEYVLTLEEQDGEEETISGGDVGLVADPEDRIQKLLEEQNIFEWPFRLAGEGRELSFEYTVSLSQEKLEKVMAKLSCMDRSKMRKAVNATLSDYEEGVGFTLKPAVPGTEIKASVLEEQVTQALTEMAATLDLAATGCYEEAEYPEDSPEALAMLDRANFYGNTKITYEFGDKKEVLDGSILRDWLIIGDDLSVTLDTDKATEYVAALAEKYDTKWKSKKLVTHSGKEITLAAGGNYGWRINQEETVAALQKYLKEGKDYTGEVVFYQRAASFDTPDYGNTYIEVSISAQHMWYYKEGTCVFESDFVSGDVTKGRGTPTGAYQIAYKARNQVLKGQGYSSPVKYWMPFVEGVGFHDASWRGSFGGSIYRGNGSHGCLNLPSWAAAELYKIIEAGTAVLLY